MAYGTVAIGTALGAVAFLYPYLAQAPITLAMPGAVLAVCVFVVALEGPTRKRIRALLESDPSLQVASWEYSAEAWPDVVRAAPGPGWSLTLMVTALTTVCVALVAGLGTQDERALLLAAAWAVALLAALTLVSTMSVTCLAICDMFSKAVFEAFSSCFTAAPKTSPAIGVAPVFSIRPAALWRMLLYCSSSTDVTSRCRLADQP